MSRRASRPWVIAAWLSVLACSRQPSTSRDVAPSGPAPASAVDDDSAERSFELTRLRRAHRTEVFAETPRGPAPEPPGEIFDRIHYPAPLGDNVAYVTPVSKGDRRPAIVWITGGFNWGIGESSWRPAPRSNDQSAASFREAGLVLMRPSLRGSNDNPGRNECFLGEVDDVIAAGRYLASRPDVDPDRIYLGGHSTGGTLVLLVAASTERFRGVIAFGPVDDPRGYGECIPTDLEGPEARLRAPIEFLDQIRNPTLIIEGTEGGNTTSFGAFELARGDAPVQLLAVSTADHFDVLAPVSELLARAIVEGRDLGARDPVSLVDAARAMGRPEGAVTPEAQRVVRAARWPAIFRKVFDRTIEQRCSAAAMDPQECHFLRAAFSETVVEALLVDAVSEIPSEALAKAIRFYESEGGQTILDFMLDSEGPRPTAEQIQRFEQYQAGNPEVEGPKGEAIIGGVIEGYLEHVFD